MQSTAITADRFRRTASIDIVLLGDQLIFREGLRKLFEAEPGFAVVGDAADADQALKTIAALRPDIIIVNLSGRALARALRKLRFLTGDVRVRTILLTSTIEKVLVEQAQELGVSGVLSKDTSPQVLFDSVRAVSAGLCWLGGGPSLGFGESRRPSAPIPAHRFGLTDRELQVVQGVVRGDTNKAIARQLLITQHTVKRHLANIFTKTGLFSRLQLAVFAMDHQLTPAAPAAAPVVGWHHPGAFAPDHDRLPQIASLVGSGV